MRNLLLIFLVSISIIAKGQTSSNCKELISVFPTMEKYGLYLMVQPPTCNDNEVIVYYMFDEFDDQQNFIISLKDSKPNERESLIRNAEDKYEMAKTSKDETTIKLSRFKLGSKSLVAHDHLTGIKMGYMYKCILKNRYILTINLNSDRISNLDEFQDFIIDYLSKIKEGGLSN